MAGFLSCKEEDQPGNVDKCFVYLTMDGSKASSATINIDLENQGDALLNVSVSYHGTYDYNRSNIEATVEADLTLVDHFNTDQGTDYLPLPAEAYSFGTKVATIVSGGNSSEPLQLTFKQGNISLSNTYVLPLTVKSISGGDNALLSTYYSTLYLIFTADIDDEIDRDHWTSGGASSVWQAGYEVENVFDGNANTYWHTDLTGLPQWFIVDMDGNKRIDGFTLNNRKDFGQDALPKHIRFEVSLNKTDWRTVLEVNELPQTRLGQVLPVEKTVIARYIRVTVLSSWNDAPYTYLAELGIYSGEAPAVEQELEREKWTVVDFSSQWSEGWGAAQILNDNLSVPWHTDPADQMPHWVIVDMKQELKITGFIYVNNHSTDAAPKRIRFETSMDGSSWTTATVVDDVPNILLDFQTFPCDSPVAARYFKLTIEANYADAPFTYMSYISIY